MAGLKLKLDLKGTFATVKGAIGFRRPAAADLVLAAGVISLTVVVLGLLSVPAYHDLQLRVKAAAVVGNAATLQLAAETYAAAHGGEYADGPGDLIPYLPEQKAPVNPYSAEPIVFRGGAGDLIYQPRPRTGNYIIRAYAMGSGGRPELVASLTGRGTP